MEREGFIPPEEKKIFIPKDGEIFEALTKGIEDLVKKEKKVPIDREDFLLRVLNDRDSGQAIVNTANGVIDKLLTYESLNLKLSYYTLEKSHRYGFDICKKPKAGFRKDES